jgi:hypothetical protein
MTDVQRKYSAFHHYQEEKMVCMKSFALFL